MAGSSQHLYLPEFNFQLRRWRLFWCWRRRWRRRRRRRRWKYGRRQSRQHRFRQRQRGCNCRRHRRHRRRGRFTSSVSPKRQTGSRANDARFVDDWKRDLVDVRRFAVVDRLRRALRGRERRRRRRRYEEPRVGLDPPSVAGINFFSKSFLN